MAANLRLTASVGGTWLALEHDQPQAVAAVLPAHRTPTLAAFLAFAASVTLRPSPWTPRPHQRLRGLAYTRAWNRMHAQFAPAPHVYLMTIGVDPHVQGHGWGRRLLAAVLAHTDSAGVGVYLET